MGKNYFCTLYIERARALQTLNQLYLSLLHPAAYLLYNSKWVSTSTFCLTGNTPMCLTVYLTLFGAAHP